MREWLARARGEGPGLALMFALTLATRLPFLGHPAADFDEQLYSLIGQRMRLGAIPYVDLWDRKPPGLFALFWLAHAIGGDGPAAYQGLGLLACLGGALCVWRLARRMTGPGTAAFASGLYPLLMALYGSESGQSEVFFTPLLAGMALLLVRAEEAAHARRALQLCLVAMAMGGLVLQVKYTALAQCLFFGLAALVVLHRRGWRARRLAGAAGLFAVLGVLPTLLAWLVFMRLGAGDAFVFANFVSITRRAALPLSFTLRAQLLFALPLLLLAAGGALLRHERLAGRARALWLVAAGWLAAGLAGLFMGSTLYTYYYAALVPSVILVALPMFDPRGALGGVTLAAALAGLLVVFDPPGHVAASRSERATLGRMVRLLAPQVGARRHCLFVFDGPVALYRLAGSGLPTRFIYPDHLDNRLEEHALPVSPESEVARILAARPGAIVTTRDAITLRNRATDAEVTAALHRSYRLLATFDFQDRRLALYARTADADGRAPDCAPRG
ncbi:MAG: glycosyltransferase family 39 protein [Sphingomonadales bacterium]|nr:glycosyltransferase family 39 protein [Sphingomonadales bacterium]